MNTFPLNSLLWYVDSNAAGMILRKRITAVRLHSSDDLDIFLSHEMYRDRM
jgi:hypothetical protein